MNIIEITVTGVITGGVAAALTGLSLSVIESVESKPFRTMSSCVIKVSNSHGMQVDEVLIAWAEQTLPVNIWGELAECVTGVTGTPLLEGEPVDE